MFLVPLDVPHVLPDVGVQWEHRAVLGGLGALQGKIKAECLTSGVKFFLLESFKS